MEEKWREALAWYASTNEAGIEALLEVPPYERTEEDWLRLAAIAMDQGGVNPNRMAFR